MKFYSIVKECQRYTTDGNAYEDITCTYPFLKPFFFEYETQFNDCTAHSWMVDHSNVPIIACCLYGIGIYYGKYIYFANRPAWNWRFALALWNFSLSAFSLIGLTRVLPYVIHMWTHYTWRENFCMDGESNGGGGMSGFWLLLFCLSKFPELLDTLFIVIHKKHLILLHWYHHISVLLFCWQSYVTGSPVGIQFATMNYAVHAFMYFYYFLMSIHCKPKYLNALYITVAQISQMIVGVVITIVGCYLVWFDPVTRSLQNTENYCRLNAKNVSGGVILYGSYLALFLKFFVERYFRKNSKNVKALSTSKANYLSDASKSGVTNGTYINEKEITKKRVVTRKED